MVRVGQAGLKLALAENDFEFMILLFLLLEF